ncbi:MAG: pyruvate kinase [Phycisphaerae bacterium]
MPKTKIVATIGPASANKETLHGFFESGVTVVRFNMSHGTLTDHQRSLDLVREVAGAMGLHIATFADLCGPKVRTQEMNLEQATIATGESCVIVPQVDVGTAKRFGTNHVGLIDEVEPGHSVLIDDGAIRLRAVERTAEGLVCQCEVGGTIGSRKGINVPDSNLSLASLSDKDRVDLAWAIENELDFVALSFVRSPEDIELLRDAIRDAGSEIPIISKIETPQAIARLDEIINASNVVLVARGDLGVEMEVSRIPMLQKDMVVRCRQMGRPVIIATQMLHSMVDSATPTRAEVSDVANAVLDGTDAVMLSAESAMGRFPLESVRVMSRIIEHAHDYRYDKTERRGSFVTGRLRVGADQDRTASAVARSAVIVAQDLRAKLIAVWSRTGRTARWISKYQASLPIYVLSKTPSVCRRCEMSYGIGAMLVPQEFIERGVSWEELQRRLVERTRLDNGEVIVLVGDPAAPMRVPTISIRVIET